MTESSSEVRPAKCSHCERPMSTPIVCDFCQALNAVPATTDYFALLDVPRRFDLDQQLLHRKFLALSQHAHPDFHTGDSPEVQQLSLRVCAALNDAYRTLKDPARRAAYLLEVLGGKSSVEDKAVPEGFLGTMMMMQEEIADAKEAGQQHELDRLREVLQTQHDGLIHRIAGLFGEHQEAIACNAVRKDFLGEIRRQVNAVSYVRKLLSLLGQLPARTVGLDAGGHGSAETGRDAEAR